MTLTQLDTTPALVVIDLQRGITGMDTAHPTGPIVEQAGTLATAFRAHDLPVVLVTVTDVAPGRTDAAGASGPFPPDFAELEPALGEHPDDIRIVKQRWGAFTGSELHGRLRAAGVTQVVLCGIATTAGVESTARSAHELGYHVVLVTDAMTDRSAAAHDHSVEHVFPRLGETTTAAEVRRRLDAR